MISLNAAKQISLGQFKQKITFLTRQISNASEEIQRQNELFKKEAIRQREEVGRIEKIEVNYEGIPENQVFIMNKNISTPYDCAKHLGDKIKTQSVLAILNGDTYWHMHKPLPDSCKLEFVNYHATNPAFVNKAFWRSCSFLLGATISSAFKDNIQVKLHSFPSPNVKSGSFVYDVQLSLDNWQPTQQELKTLSLETLRFCQQKHKIQTLDVDKEFALDMFKHNPHKVEQIPDIAAHNNEKVTLFKVGTHVDISRGPMIPNTNHVGRFTVANVMKLDTDIGGAPIYRFQGVALPYNIVLNHFAYGLLEDRARKLNSARIPGAHGTVTEDTSFESRITA